MAAHPEIARAHLIVGLARRGRGATESAREALREAVRRGASDASAHLALAECELALGDAARALLEATRAREAGAPLADTAILRSRAHLGRQEGREALRVLEEIPPSSRSLEVLTLLGRLRLDAGDLGGARSALEEVFSRGSTEPEALEAMARLCLREGRIADALPHALRALSERPTQSSLSVLVGEIHRGLGKPDAALCAFERAVDLAPEDVDALVAAGEAALALGDLVRARTYFERARAIEPDHVAARDGTERVLQRQRLAEESERRERGAATEIEAGVRPDETYAVLVRAHRLLASEPELQSLSPDAAQLREGYDRPLLLAIAGEFNAGKSTLLNALLGDAVAPMGVTPTTAAVNVFLYGHRRTARAVLHDGSAEEVPLERVPELVDARRGAGGGAVRHVEMIWPAEPLREVSLVDTPGFNAAEERHEEVARAFLNRADAVLWVFDAAHAGSASERSAIEALGPLRGKVVGVLNKADHLSAEDRAQVLGHLEKSFGDEVAAWVAVSSRDALEARRRDDDAALAASGFPGLWTLLEARFFDRARSAKRESSLARLRDLLARASAMLDALQLAGSAAERYAALRREEAVSLGAQLTGEVVPALVEHHRAGLHRVVVETARDALGVARRRKGGIAALISPKLGEADQRFLARVLGDRIRAHLDDLWTRATNATEAPAQRFLTAWDDAPAELRAVAEPNLAWSARAVVDLREDLRAGPFERAAAYARGWLDGGGLGAAAGPLAKAETEAAAQDALRAILPKELPWKEPYIGFATSFSRALERVADECLRAIQSANAGFRWRLREPLRELVAAAERA